jgi:FkbM family methyltransferase
LDDSSIKGTFVELGAFDGSIESNSMFFERCLGWKGLLIEGNPENFQKVLRNRPLSHRMSFAPSCDAEYEMVNKTVQFYRYPMTNVGLVGSAKTYEGKPTVDVPCGPLGPVLKDVFEEEQRVAFFSLDVEGAEPMVLETIDFDSKLIIIEVLMIEVENDNCRRVRVCETRDKVRAKMAKHGYRRYEKGWFVNRISIFILRVAFKCPTLQWQPDL